MAGNRPLRSVILASASPQRSALLRQLGIEPDVRPTAAVEVEEGDDPVAVAVDNARAKYLAAAEELGPADDGRLLVACDTVVALADGTILGKPASGPEALAMLGRLSGARHEVHSGLATGRVAGARASRPVLESATTGVWVAELSDAEIEWYVAQDDWHGRAGGYAIQAFAAPFVTRIDGDYTNVVGLPLPILWPHLFRQTSRSAK